MKWTPEATAKFRELAATGMGSAGLSNHFGISVPAAQSKASGLRVRIGPGALEVRYSAPEELRDRWRDLLPRVKLAIRADIEREMARFGSTGSAAP